MVRFFVPLMLAAACAGGQNAAADQRPRYQPGWPCTGKEPSFDPSHARVAEATGGQMFLFDRSEAGRSMALIDYTSKHPATVARAAGKLEGSYRDIQAPVDSSIDSLLVSVTLQCMQAIAIYGPAGVEIRPEDLGGENHWFRAGRIAVVPNPAPGIWTIRLQGAGPFFLAVQARTNLQLRPVQFSDGAPKMGSEQTLTAWIGTPAPGVRFRLIDAGGETLQPLPLDAAEDAPGKFSGRVVPAFGQFRVLAEGTDERGYAFQRVDPRLLEAKPAVP